MDIINQSGKKRKLANDISTVGFRKSGNLNDGNNPNNDNLLEIRFNLQILLLTYKLFFGNKQLFICKFCLLLMLK